MPLGLIPIGHGGPITAVPYEAPDKRGRFAGWSGDERPWVFAVDPTVALVGRGRKNTDLVVEGGRRDLRPRAAQECLRRERAERLAGLAVPGGHPPAADRDESLERVAKAAAVTARAPRAGDRGRPVRVPVSRAC